MTNTEEEFRKRLYEHFLYDTPITFESVTEEQWATMRKTLAASGIALGIALESVHKHLAEVGSSILEFFKGLNK